MSYPRSYQPAPNPGYDQTIAILREAGYQCGRQFRASDSALPGFIPSEDCFEVWLGPKGVVIVQRWTKGNGAMVYLGWGAGSTFEELKAALAVPPILQWEDLTDNDHTARALIRRACDEPTSAVRVSKGGRSVLVCATDTVDEVNDALCSLG